MRERVRVRENPHNSSRKKKEKKHASALATTSKRIKLVRTKKNKIKRSCNKSLDDKSGMKSGQFFRLRKRKELEENSLVEKHRLFFFSLLLFRCLLVLLGISPDVILCG